MTHILRDSKGEKERHIREAEAKMEAEVNDGPTSQECQGLPEVTRS